MEITKYIEKVDKIYKECKEERKVEGINVQGLSNSINKEISLYEVIELQIDLIEILYLE